MSTTTILRESIRNVLLETFYSLPEEQQFAVITNLFLVIGSSSIGLYNSQDGFQRLYDMVYGQSNHHAVVRDFLLEVSAKFFAEVRLNSTKNPDYPSIDEIADASAQALYSFSSRLDFSESTCGKFKLPYETPSILIETTITAEELVNLMDLFPWYLTLCSIYLYANIRGVIGEIASKAANPKAFVKKS